MTIYRGPGGTGTATSDSDTTEFQEFVFDAQAARDAALAAQTAAELAETNAETAETNAETAETNAETAATNAASSASSAASSASSASSSASSASTSASNASSSASSASTSASAASSSASAASTSASNAATSATNAASSATAAASSATSASSSASTATTQATNAAASASAASTSASSASAAKTAAEAARDAALSAYDNFDDRYLGPKSSDPTLDNDGNALLTGALYFNTASNVMKVYTGSSWVAAYVSAAGVLLAASNLSDVASTATSRTNLGAAGTGVSNTFTANQIVSVTDNTNAALRITQLGTGNALLVEDSSNPDATPFVIDASGNVVSGSTASIQVPYYSNGTNTTPLFQVAKAGGFISSLLGSSSSSGFGPSLSFSRSSGDSLTVPTVVSSGFDIGSLSFQGYDGTNFIRGAEILAEVDGTPGTNDMPGRLVFSTTADGASSPTERMRIDSAGRVGMGTTSLSALLTVNSETDTTTYNGSATDGQLTAGATQLIRAAAGANTNVAQLVFQSRASQPFNRIVSSGGTAPFMAFATNNAERVRITSAGDVGIGASSTNRLSLTYDGGTGAATIGPNSTGGSTYLTLGTSNAGTYAERARIDSSGNVGIGTSSPSSRLDVRTSAAEIGRFSSSATNGGYQIFYPDNVTTPVYVGSLKAILATGNATDFAIIGTGANNLVLGTNSAERARIDSSGNLLVGTTSVPSTGAGTNSTIVSNKDYSGAFAQIINSSSTSGTQFFIQFGRGSSECGKITSTGTNSTTYATSSDYRLKHEIVPLTGALAKIAALKPCTYKWKSDNSSGEGFIAHELAEVVPDAVVGEKDAVNEDGSIKPQGIDTSFLVATLTAAIQELKAINDAQAETITALTARVTALESN